MGAPAARPPPPPPPPPARPLTPAQAEPAQGLQLRLNSAGDVAGAVRVLDAEDEGAALVAGEEPVEQSGADVADVGCAGGAGRVAHADGRGHERMLAASLVQPQPEGW